MEAWNKLIKALARHTSGGVAALHKQLPQRWEEALFHTHSLNALRGKPTAVLPYTLQPPDFSQSVLSYGKPGRPTAALVSLWTSTAAAELEVSAGSPAPALSEQALHFHPVASLKFQRHRFGWPVADTVLRPGDFVRSSSDRSPSAQLLKLRYIFYFADRAPSAAPPPVDPARLPLYFVAEEWKQPGDATVFLNQQRRSTGALVLGRTASLNGKALTWASAPDADTVLFAPALERY